LDRDATAKKIWRSPVFRFRRPSCRQRVGVVIAEDGPTLPTWALQQVGSYLMYTGRGVN
jgi:hypothetical protein